MSLIPLSVGNVAASVYTADAAAFGGTVQCKRSSAWDGPAVDSKSAIFSGWFNFTGGDGAWHVLLQMADGIGFNVARDSGNKIECVGHNSGSAEKLRIDTTANFTASSGWNHFLISFDLATTTVQMYVNDSSDIAITYNVNDTLDYTRSNECVGGYQHNGQYKPDADMFDLYLLYGTHLDLTTESNRRKFIDAAGKPVAWADILSEVGTPIMGLHLDEGEAPANFGDNADGSGGSIAASTGTLTTASTSPTD